MGRFIRLLWLALIPVFAVHSDAAAKPHALSFGAWITVKWNTEPDPSKPLTLKIRPLLVDGRVREYVLGSPHDVTDRLFVVRRAFRLNDSLPEDSGAPRWQWQRGGWILVDRTTGRISPLILPEFDALYSLAAWYRDYAAYCGVSDDGKKIDLFVIQLGRRRPVLKKPLVSDGLPDDAPPDSACAAPLWQRTPTRVTFEANGARQTFAIRGHAVDLVSHDDEEDEDSK